LNASRGLTATIVLTLISFLVASHLAWLNPRPGFEIYRTIDEWPFMWQYNADAGMEIISAAYFPEGFREYPQRINRPLYPALSWLFGAVIGTVVSPVVDLSPLERAGAGYIVLKIMMHVLGGLALVDLLRRRLSDRAAVFALALVLLHPHTIAHIATFHTTDLQILVPIFVLWMLVRLVERDASEGRSRRWWIDLAVYSFVTGILMLGKQNFAVYAAILVWALALRRWREVLLSVGVFLLPVLLYIVFLRHVGLTYRNNEIASMDQGTWVLELLVRQPVVLLKTVLESLGRFMVNAVAFWGAIVFLAFVALGHREVPVTRRELWLLFLFAGATWAQYLAVRRFEVAYMVGDLSVYVFGLAAWLLVDRWFRRPPVTRVIIVLYGAWAIFSFVHLPWVSPWEQAYRERGYLETRLEAVEDAAQ